MFPVTCKSADNFTLVPSVAIIIRHTSNITLSTSTVDSR